MSEINKIPAGYRMDAFGRMVPEAKIKAIDLARDELVQEIAAAADKVNQAIVAFKKKAFADIQAFIDLSVEQYGVKVGGDAGNAMLLSFDGAWKVQRSVQKHIRFDERLLAAKALIDACITDWVKDANPNIHLIIEDAFQVDKTGQINTGRVLSLRRLKIEDERWAEAMQAICDAMQVTGSKSYVRVYKRDSKGEYKSVALDVANA